MEGDTATEKSSSIEASSRWNGTVWALSLGPPSKRHVLKEGSSMRESQDLLCRDCHKLGHCSGILTHGEHDFVKFEALPDMSILVSTEPYNVARFC